MKLPQSIILVSLPLLVATSSVTLRALLKPVFSVNDLTTSASYGLNPWEPQPNSHTHLASFIYQNHMDRANERGDILLQKSHENYKGKHLAVYSCKDPEFLGYVVDHYTRHGASVCYIDIYNNKRRYKQYKYKYSVILNYYVSDESMENVSSYGTLDIPGVNVYLSGDKMKELFKKSRNKKYMHLPGKAMNEIEELDDGFMESFVFHKHILYKLDWETMTKVPLDSLIRN